jgi:hypothetical protein
VSVTQVGKATTFIDPDDGSVDLLNDRPPLVLRAVVAAPTTTTLDANVIVVANHLRSLNDVDSPTSSRVRVKREKQAEFLADLINDLQAEGAVISVGDYNAFEQSDGLVDVLGTVRGAPTPEDQVVVASTDLVEPNFVNAAPGAYSYVFAGNAQALDHILLSNAVEAIFSGAEHARINADFPEVYRNDPTRIERLSDHDPAVAYFTFQPDLTPSTIASVTPSTTTLWPPDHRMEPITFSVQATDNRALAQCVVTNVASDEAIDGTGDGDFGPDWSIDAPLVVSLRAERTGSGDGRTYTVTVSCADAAANSATSSTDITVPHSQH